MGRWHGASTQGGPEAADRLPSVLRASAAAGREAAGAQGGPRPHRRQRWLQQPHVHQQPRATPTLRARSGRARRRLARRLTHARAAAADYGGAHAPVGGARAPGAHDRARGSAHSGWTSPGTGEPPSPPSLLPTGTAAVHAAAAIITAAAPPTATTTALLATATATAT